MKCSNCSDEALYEYRITHSKSVFYCGKHLPKFLEARRKAGVLTVTQAMPDILASAVDALSSKVEEQELPIIEEPTETAPKKKATKKKAQ